MAQNSATTADGHSHAHHTVAAPSPTRPTLSAKAREQIAEVERAVAKYDTPEAAQAAGFRPTLGMIPTMGVHWVNLPRMLDGVSLDRPDNLMFSTVNGKPKLVGVAYAFPGQLTEAPDLFDGEGDVWHEHPELAPPGFSLVMLHVWFVPSSDGAFSGHNSWLGYWAAGMEPPADSVMSDSVAASRARRLALALAEAMEPMALAQTSGMTNDTLMMLAIGMMMSSSGAKIDTGYSIASALPQNIQQLRDSLRAGIPRLQVARKAGDQARWNREADAMIATWEHVRDAYLAAIPLAALRDPLAKLYHEMETGGHHH